MRDEIDERKSDWYIMDSKYMRQTASNNKYGAAMAIPTPTPVIAQFQTTSTDLLTFGMV
jgi:hypothetical protein